MFLILHGFSKIFFDFAWFSKDLIWVCCDFQSIQLFVDVSNDLRLFLLQLLHWPFYGCLWFHNDVNEFCMLRWFSKLFALTCTYVLWIWHKFYGFSITSQDFFAIGIEFNRIRNDCERFTRSIFHWCPTTL